MVARVLEVRPMTGADLPLGIRLDSSLGRILPGSAAGTAMTTRDWPARWVRSLTLDDRDANATFRYVADLPHVREIALLGTSDPAFWKDRLAEDDLSPIDFGGRATRPDQRDRVPIPGRPVP